MRAAWSEHLPEYAAEALGLGLFMLSACVFGVLLFHPDGALHDVFASDRGRRAAMGLAMGATAVGLVHAPWGRRSGAHLNPAVTLAFLRLRKIRPADAAAYAVAQAVGGASGVLLARALIGAPLAHASTRFVATRPGAAGAPAAFAAEAAISFLLMSVVLRVASSRRPRLTGVCAGALVALYITFEAPVSGMSMNPARSLASALFAREALPALWIYALAPVLGMNAAAAVAPAARCCAKLDHRADEPCIHCGRGRAAATHPVLASSRSMS